MSKGAYVTDQHNTASWLWLLGLLGFCGIHRIYLGKRVTGVLWLLTLGLYGMGQLYDLFTLKSMLKDSNTKFLCKVKSSSPTYNHIPDWTPVKPQLCEYCDAPKNNERCIKCGAIG